MASRWHPCQGDAAVPCHQSLGVSALCPPLGPGRAGGWSVPGNVACIGQALVFPQGGRAFGTGRPLDPQGLNKQPPPSPVAGRAIVGGGAQWEFLKGHSTNGLQGLGRQYKKEFKKSCEPLPLTCQSRNPPAGISLQSSWPVAGQAAGPPKSPSCPSSP